jgi:katanin p80 WD40 repeat-containing subunit B1
MDAYKMHEFVAHDMEVNCLSFGPRSNELLATGGEDCKVNIWRVGNAKNLWTLGSNKSAVESLCFDDEEQCIVSGSISGSLKVFDLNEGRLARSLRGHQVRVLVQLGYPPALQHPVWPSD